MLWQCDAATVASTPDLATSYTHPALPGNGAEMCPIKVCARETFLSIDKLFISGLPKYKAVCYYVYRQTAILIVIALLLHFSNICNLYSPSPSPPEGCCKTDFLSASFIDYSHISLVIAFLTLHAGSRLAGGWSLGANCGRNLSIRC